MMGILFLILFGGVAGWLAGKIMQGRGYGPIGNVVVGMVGGLIGGILFRFLGLVPIGLVGRLTVAVAGGVVLIYVVRQIQSR